MHRKLLRDVTFLVLFSYILLIFNCLIPLSADTLAHTFWKQQHLESVHKVKGKLHVKEEVREAAAQAEKDQSAGTEKSFQLPVHMLPAIIFSAVFFFFIQSVYPAFWGGRPSSYSSLTYIPPETAIN